MSPFSCGLPGRVLTSLAAILLLAQALAANDPANASLRVTQVQKLLDGRYQVTLQWDAFSGATYEVQGQNELSQTGWLNFGLVTPATSTGQWQGIVASHLVDEGRFFMRLVLPQPDILSLEPGFVAAGGGVFYVLGQCFTATDVVYVNGAAAVATVFEDHTRLRVTVGAMTAGVYDVEVRDNTGAVIIDALPDSLAVTANGLGDEVPPRLPAVMGFSLTDSTFDPSRLLFRRRGDTVLEDIQCGAVHPPTGEVTCCWIEVLVPCRGTDFVWKRTYRSKNGPSTAQGEGWDFSYNIFAVQSGVDMVVHDGEGRADTFFRQTDGTFSRPEFFRQGTLSGNVFTLTFADTAAWRFRAFDGSPAEGKIDRITDRNGNHLDFAYDGLGRLQIVMDTLGRSYTIVYNPAGRIESITDFSGRAVTYGYNPDGDLLTATSPPVVGTPTGNDFPLGKTITYSYSSGFADPRLNHNLLTITDPLGQLVMQNAYAATLIPADFDFDRCTVQTFGGALAETTTYTYLQQTPGPANRFAVTLTIVNERGDVTEFLSDSRNRPLEVRDFTGRSPNGVFVTDTLNRPTGQLRPGDPAFFVTRLDWNSDSLPVRIEVPRGGLIEKFFQGDFSLPVDINPRERGNLRVQVTTAAPGEPSDFVTITEQWEYKPGFGAAEGCQLPGGIKFMETPVQLAPGLVYLPYGGDECVLWTVGFSTSSDNFCPRIVSNTTSSDGMVDLFNSNAGKFTLPVQKDAQIYETYYKAFVGLKRDGKGAGSTVKPHLDVTKNAARIIGLNLGDQLLPNASGSSGFGFNGTSFPTVHIDGRGHLTTFGYDANGNLTLIDPPETGTEHTWTYNAFGQPSTHLWPQNASGHARRDDFTYHGPGPQEGLLDQIILDATGLALTTQLEHNTVGIVTRVIDPTGNDLLFTPNALNQIVRVTSPEVAPGIRYERDFHYDANNNLVRIDIQNKDETGALVAANPALTTTYVYDVLNRLVRTEREVDTLTIIATERVIDANNHTVTFRSGEAVAGSQPLNTVRITFDERSLPFQFIQAPTSTDETTTQYDYDLDGNLARVTDGVGEPTPREWDLEWDGMLRVNKIEALTIKQKVTDNAIGEMRDYEKEPTSVEIPNLVITLAESHASDLYKWHEDYVIELKELSGRFDPFDYVIPEPGASADPVETQTEAKRRAVRELFERDFITGSSGGGEFDGLLGAVPHSVTDPMGNETTYTYDANGNRIKVRVDGEHNDVAGDTGNVRLVEFNFSVDNNDLPVVFTGLLLDPSGVQIGSASRGIIWAPNGQVDTVTDPLGNTTTYEYDTMSRVATVTDAKGNETAYTYDSRDNRLTTTSTEKSDLGNPDQVFVVTNTYDGLSRPLTIADNVGNTTEYLYDSRSLVVETTDPRGIETRHEYDGLGRPLSTARDMDNDGADAGDAQDLVVTYTWNFNSYLEGFTNANGHATTHGFDDLNRHITTTNPDGTTVTRVYDAFGNLVQVEDANGTFTFRMHDANGRIVQHFISPAGGVAFTTSTETFGHDGLGRLKTADSSGSAGTTSSSFAYDSLGRLVSETQGAHTVSHTYDAAGNCLSTTFPAGNTVTFVRDSLNRVASSTDSVMGAVVTNNYIGPDRLERQVFGNGTQADYEYDGLLGTPNTVGDNGWRQVRGIEITSAGPATLDASQYSYSENQIQTQRFDFSGVVHVYTHDNADRLVDTTVMQGPTTLRHTVYNLDKAGNRISVTGDNHPGAYAQNPTLPIPGDAQMNQYSASPGRTYLYDDNGNRVQANVSGQLLQYVHDFANRMVAVNNLTLSQPVATYKYDALGRMVERVVNPAAPTPDVTRFVFDGSSIIEERDALDALKARMVISENNSINVVRGGNLQMLHSDYAGNIRLATGPSGGAIERYEYQDFGEPEFFSGAGAPLSGSAINNPILWSGMRFHFETGLYEDDGLRFDPVIAKPVQGLTQLPIAAHNYQNNSRMLPPSPFNRATHNPDTFRVYINPGPIVPQPASGGGLKQIPLHLSGGR